MNVCTAHKYFPYGQFREINRQQIENGERLAIKSHLHIQCQIWL